MKKAIFIDRDGTIISEPEDEQVDSLEKFHFVPGVISALKSLSDLGYEFVLVTNQDGLGTASFPESDFLPPHRLMIETLAGEGIFFDDQLIDRHFPEDNSPERKPGTGMFGKYLNGDYDLGKCFVIGDRESDMQLAENLGATGILLTGADSTFGQQQASLCSSLSQPDGCGSLPFTWSRATTACRCPKVLSARAWEEIAEIIRSSERAAVIGRKTKETDIYVRVDLDGKGPSEVDTGLKFFDHMLSQLIHHGGIGLQVKCKGDLEVDEHHTVEDVGIALGEAIGKALGDKMGIERYGFVLPMDECKATVLLDFGGRAELVWDVPFTREYVGDVPTEMFKHFFKSLSGAMKCNLHVYADGENNHHLIEGVFKAFARALRQAVRRNVFSYELPSSKGVL